MELEGLLDEDIGSSPDLEASSPGKSCPGSKCRLEEYYKEILQVFGLDADLV